jgi:hypothetical protein
MRSGWYSSGKVKTRAAPAVVILLGLCGCQSVPDYSPPEQRPSFAGFKAHLIRVLNMDDPDAPTHFVRDISLGTDTSWRWTGQKPAVKLRIRSVANLKYFIDFTLPEVTFRDTGPVTIAFTVNDHVLDRVRYAAAGYQHFEKAVPQEWLELNKDAVVGAEVDKMWVSKEDGTQFGFILSRIGLIEVRTE